MVSEELLKKALTYYKKKTKHVERLQVDFSHDLKDAPEETKIALIDAILGAEKQAIEQQPTEESQTRCPKCGKYECEHRRTWL